MGYMGFGMQNWIYRQRPRRAFSKFKKTGVDTIHHDTWDDLNIEGRTQKNKKYAKRYVKEVLKRIQRRSLTNKIISLFIIITILSITIILIVHYRILDSPDIPEQYQLNEQKKIEERDNTIFDLSMSYGNNYLRKGDIELAIREFIQALEVYPNNIEAKESLAKSYLQDCFINGNNCENALSVYNELTEKYPDNYQYQSSKITLEQRNRK